MVSHTCVYKDAHAALLPEVRYVQHQDALQDDHLGRVNLCGRSHTQLLVVPNAITVSTHNFLLSLLAADLPLHILVCNHCVNNIATVPWLCYDNVLLECRCNTCVEPTHCANTTMAGVHAC